MKVDDAAWCAFIRVGLDEISAVSVIVRKNMMDNFSKLLFFLGCGVKYDLREGRGWRPLSVVVRGRQAGGLFSAGLNDFPFFSLHQP